jgi:hypothetical protein
MTLAALAMGVGAAAAQPAPPAAPVTERPADLGSAVTSPLEDLNLKRVDLPEVLVRSVANPYDLRTLDRCVAIAAEVARLDAALGPDRDLAPAADTRSTTEKNQARAATVLRTGAQAVTPYRGVIRWVTGAARHQDKVDDAIGAGFTRRGYLKGVGMRMNCAPPAAPAWFKPTPPPRPAARPAAPRRNPG